MNKIFITSSDYQKLKELLQNKEGHTDEDLALINELSRATILDLNKTVKDIVIMNSQIVFRDEQTNQVKNLTLVFPENADFSQGKISVLSPLGCALLGEKVGHSIFLKTPKGEKKILIEKILYPVEGEKFLMR